MTKMATMPIYGKNLKKSSSLEPKGLWPWKLVCSHAYSSTTKFVQMMTLGWPWPILRQGQIGSPMHLYGKKVNQWIFSETIVAYDIKVSRCSQLNEYMKLFEYQRSKSFIKLGPNLSDSIFLNFFSSITTRLIEAKFHVEPPKDAGTKACSNGPGHMTKMAAMPIYGKKPLKIFSGTERPMT